MSVCVFAVTDGDGFLELFTTKQGAYEKIDQITEGKNVNVTKRRRSTKRDFVFNHIWYVKGEKCLRKVHPEDMEILWVFRLPVHQAVGAAVKSASGTFPRN